MEKNKIVDITFGVLYKKSFGIMDSWGSIADGILNKKPYFSPSYFPNITSHYNLQGQLSNPNTGDYLIVSAENLVYKHHIESSFDKEFKDFKSRVSKYLIPDIVFKNKLEVIRLGIVYSYELSALNCEELIKKFFRPEFKGVSDFRFSIKEASTSGGTVSGINDYCNKIYTVGSIGDNKKGITFDYQLFFDPAREFVNDIIDKFLQTSFNSFEKEMNLEKDLK